MQYEHHAGRNRSRRSMTDYLTGPRRLAPSFDVEPHLAQLDEDGFTIVEDYMSGDQLASFREGLKPYLGSYRGRGARHRTRLHPGRAREGLRGNCLGPA